MYSCSLIGIVIVFISLITKYLVEKYYLKYSGRQITIHLAYVNPFADCIHFNNFKIGEFGSVSMLLSAKGVNALFKI